MFSLSLNEKFISLKLFFQRFCFKEIFLKTKFKLITTYVKAVGKHIELPNLNETRLQLQLTNICNANCNFCAYGKLGKRNLGFMPDDIFYKVVGQFLDAGGKDFGLNSTVGEPLVDRDIIKKIKYLREKSPDGHIYLFTNILFLDNFNIDEFLLSGLNLLNISTTAFDEEIYLRVYGSNQYDRFYRNISTLLKRNEELDKPIKIYIHFRLDIPPRKAFNLEGFRRLVPHLKNVSNVSIGATHKFDSWNGIVTNEHLSGRMRLNKATIINHPCYRIKNLSIDINGNVIVCACRLPKTEAKNSLVIGNVNERPLDQLCKGQEHMRLFDGFFRKASIPEICQDCSFYSPLLPKKFISRNLSR